MAVKHNIVFAVLLFLSAFYYASGKEKKCEKIKIPMCQSIGYNLTSMPNMFNHETQEDAALEVHQFWPLVEIKCSPGLRFFLCSMYAPVCQPNFNANVPPCRSICKRARKSCAPFMGRYGLSWPHRMRCKNFPKGVGDGLCLGRAGDVAVNHTLKPQPELTKTKTTNETKCENIKILMCQNIGYHSTSLPNMFNHDTQAEAALELHKFWPLVAFKCSPDVRPFLCSVYAPMCQPNVDKEVPPCRSVCKRVRKGCASLMLRYSVKWPERMKCENFPKNSDRVCLKGFNVAANHMTKTLPKELPRTKNTSKKKCEKIKVPLCQNIGYSLTYMPNMFFQDSQELVKTEIEQFWPRPLVELKCSPDIRFFLCSVYVPICQPNFKDRVLPCRSVCERARNGCQPVMRKYGLWWPDRLRCEKFPKDVGDGMCLGGAANVEANHTTTARTTTAQATTARTTSAPTKTAHMTVTTPTESYKTSTTSKKKCEQIKIPMCQNIGYNLTSVPNMFNHDTQEEAALEIHQFWPLVEIKCSPDLKFFLCSMYAPKCQPNVKDEVPPCRSICKRARNGCAPLMRQYGFSWPKRMKCENFPRLGDKLCLNGNNGKVNHTTTAPPTKFSKTKATSRKKCETIKIPMCQNVAYNLTSMPNMFNHDTQEEAVLEVHEFWPLVESNCSPDLRLFLCSMYAPMCQPNFKDEVPPCRSICERARKGCAPLLRQYGFSWPERMKCENFPKLGDKLCLNGNSGRVNHTTTAPPTKLTTTKTTSKKKCEKIKIPMCQNIGYNLTYMPNMFNHDTQEEATLEVHQFWPLVEIKCSPDLRLFLCSMYAPMCQPNFKDEVPPCRSICERARQGCAPLMREYGFSWPERMKCDNFPKVGSDKLCMDTQTAWPKGLITTQTSKRMKCEKIRIPMCENIGYNLTHMPNMFNHDTQEEAALEVNHFWPVVNQKCSPDLRYFLCSVYAPMCQQNITRRVPPCRSLCKRARKGCLPLVRSFGLSWPERMRCRNFPKRGSGQLCIDSKGIPAN